MHVYTSPMDFIHENPFVYIQVFLSTRRGAWILNRLSTGGMPLDIMVTRRITSILMHGLPLAFMRAGLAKQLNKRLDHDLYALRPDHPPLAEHPLLNDDLGNRIACGTVKIKTDIKHFTATGVEFVDGSFEDEIDVVSFFCYFCYVFGLNSCVSKVHYNVSGTFNYYSGFFESEYEVESQLAMVCKKCCSHMSIYSESGNAIYLPPEGRFS